MEGLQVDVKKYNLIRTALAGKTDEHDVVTVRPKTFALKKEHGPELLDAVRALLLDDARIQKGITPLNTVFSFMDKQEDIRVETMLYVLVSYAVAVQQGWIRHSQITNSYFVNTDNKEVVQYVEDTHGLKVN